MTEISPPGRAELIYAAIDIYLRKHNSDILDENWFYYTRINRIDEASWHPLCHYYEFVEDSYNDLKFLRVMKGIVE